MQDISDKADSTAGATGQLPASEFNDHKNELQSAVTRSGQVLSAAILLQLAKALFINGTGAETVVDSGSGDSIILTPLTGSSGMVVPDNYAELNGCILSFEKTTANTTTASTVNFGQTGTELGAKSLVRLDGSVTAIGDVKGFCIIKWDNSNDEWVLLSNGADTYKYNISASGAVAPKFSNNEIEVDLSSGNVTISQMPVPEFIGQRVHIYGVGSGIGDIIGGTGLYANGIYFTENTGGVYLEAISLTEWRPGNGKTAEYTSGNYEISMFANGDMELDLVDSQITSVGIANAWGLSAGTYYFNTTAYVYPIAFVTNPPKIYSTNTISGSDGSSHGRDITITGFNNTVGHSLNAIAVPFNALIKGKY